MEFDYTVRMAHEFTSIHFSLEKLLEAEHFLSLMHIDEHSHFQFNLNAFLAAARNVTFVLNSSLSRVPDFKVWYELRQDEMRSDAAMRFFVDLRNISQKQGPVGFISGSSFNGDVNYRFVENEVELPYEIVGNDIRSCCGKQLQKLAALLDSCYQAMPFHACPYTAFSSEGMAVLGFALADAEVASGYPEGWTSGIDFPIDEKLKYLRREIQPVDTGIIRRISSGNFVGPNGPLSLEYTPDEFLDQLAKRLAEPNGPGTAREAFLSVIATRIQKFDK
jgi:hypothetical protein